jgi:hypothetical protein
MDPSPSSEIVSRSVDALHNAILDNLGSGSTLLTVIILKHDVFRFLFKNMGTASVNKNHTLLEKEDFVRCPFPADWDILIDKLGDGVKVASLLKCVHFCQRVERITHYVKDKSWKKLVITLRNLALTAKSKHVP